MIRQRYYPTRSADQIVWLENFRNKLGTHGAALGLAAPTVANLVADARWLVYTLGSWLPAARAYTLACTAAAKEAQSGPGGSVALVLPVFVPPLLPAADGAIPAVVPRPPGALTGIFDAVQAMKAAAGYTEAIGMDLGIEGAADSGPDFATVQPILTTTLSGSSVQVGWGWEGNAKYLDQCEIQVDRGQGWTLLTIDTTPNYWDNAAHPTNPARWKYRAIYRVGDQQVGLWSAEVSVMVGG